MHYFGFLFVLLLITTAHTLVAFPKNRHNGAPICAPPTTDRADTFLSDLPGVWDGIGSLVYVNATDGTVADSIPVQTKWTIFHNAELERIDWITSRRLQTGNISFQHTYDAIYDDCSVQVASIFDSGSSTYGRVDGRSGTIANFDADTNELTSACRYVPVNTKKMQVGCEIYNDQGQGYIPEGTLLTYQAIMRQIDSP
ncbi:hypothetical protein QKT49_gp310 [Acanthamoeba castellanii medusavirus]|uniref:Uncharacterized protein n=1 Tax=Acanthamoeba castellanii medusavirus J1 TaxID=3114988 RepID=A0A3T1CXA6_9VIRU|nr:hypothetical protein QKT49_gp310 [Acanthamoeba castellanii medusavirus]BBI30453.1 hypothetical protein [Acanthamoeba castellanii medusavirus J1]